MVQISLTQLQQIISYDATNLKKCGQILCAHLVHFCWPSHIFLACKHCRQARIIAPQLCIVQYVWLYICRSRKVVFVTSEYIIVMSIPRVQYCSNGHVCVFTIVHTCVNMFVCVSASGSIEGFLITFMCITQLGAQTHTQQGWAIVRYLFTVVIVGQLSR